MTKVLRSDCCEQPVVIKHNYGEMTKKPTVVTAWHQCIKCQEPCDAIEIEVEDRDE